MHMTPFDWFLLFNYAGLNLLFIVVLFVECFYKKFGFLKFIGLTVLICLGKLAIGLLFWLEYKFIHA